MSELPGLPGSETVKAAADIRKTSTEGTIPGTIPDTSKKVGAAAAKDSSLIGVTRDQLAASLAQGVYAIDKHAGRRPVTKPEAVQPPRNK